MPKLVQREGAEEEEEELVQPKLAPGTAGTAGPNIESGISALKGGGKPLSGAERSFFEPRLGTDLSGVRVHTGPQAHDAANSINARAFTLGSDIAFAKGEYSPGTEGGKRLMAHELAHVMQRPSMPLVQRTIDIKVKGKRWMNLNNSANLTQLLKNSFHNDDCAPEMIKDSLSNSFPDVFPYNDTLSDIIKDLLPGSLSTEILSKMVSSKRWFCIEGSSYREAMKKLATHISARIRTIEQTKKATFGYADRSSLKVNPEYWDRAELIKDEPEVKYEEDENNIISIDGPGLKAYKDMFEHQELYAVGCRMAAEAVVIVGSDGDDLKKYMGCFYHDWVPGDFGWIEASEKDPADGDEGENIIYLGGDEYWGHLEGEKIRTLKDWITLWKGRLIDERVSTMAGLIDCD